MFSRQKVAIIPVLDCPLRDQNYYFKTSAAPKILCSVSVTFTHSQYLETTVRTHTGNSSPFCILHNRMISTCGQDFLTFCFEIPTLQPIYAECFCSWGKK